MLLQLVVSRFRFLLAEKGVWLGSYVRGAWILGSCLSQQSTIHKKLVWSGLSNDLLKDHLHFCELFYLFPIFLQRFSAND